MNNIQDELTNALNQHVAKLKSNRIAVHDVTLGAALEVLVKVLPQIHNEEHQKFYEEQAAKVLEHFPEVKNATQLEELYILIDEHALKHNYTEPITDEQIDEMLSNLKHPEELDDY